MSSPDIKSFKPCLSSFSFLPFKWDPITFLSTDSLLEQVPGVGISDLSSAPSSHCHNSHDHTSHTITADIHNLERMQWSHQHQ